jgi:transcriptional regulator with XRE-family HTH domain
MAARGEASVLRLVVVFLRFRAGMTQAEFGRASRVDQSDVSRYERGKAAPPEESLHRMAEAAGVPWPVVVQVRRFYAAVLPAAAGRGDVPEAEAPALLEAALLAGATPRGEARRQSPEEARREADEIWSALERYPIRRRRRLIELAPRASRSCALAARVCAASLRAAAHDAREALELAALAFSIAQRVPEAEGLRARTLGYCQAHAGNALRVANDLDGADEAFARAWEIWGAPGEAGRELLPEWKVLSLESSLRRDQRRFPRALELLDRARAACGDDRTAIARILLKKEQVFEVVGDTEGAFSALAEAAPWIEATGDRDLLLRFRFMTANNLYHLGRHAEAAALLPEVRALAAEQGNSLDLLRVAWLEARVAAGLGRGEEAIAGLDQVRRKFGELGLPYDAALAALDLAVLWLEAGRTAEVRGLAAEMEAVFRVKKIHREALAALALFWEAAKLETATVELARRVIGELEKVNRSAPRVERPAARPESSWTSEP